MLTDVLKSSYTRQIASNSRNDGHFSKQNHKFIMEISVAAIFILKQKAVTGVTGYEIV